MRSPSSQRYIPAPSGPVVDRSVASGSMPPLTYWQQPLLAKMKPAASCQTLCTWSGVPRPVGNLSCNVLLQTWNILRPWQGKTPAAVLTRCHQAATSSCCQLCSAGPQAEGRNPIGLHLPGRCRTDPADRTDCQCSCSARSASQLAACCSPCPSARCSLPSWAISGQPLSSDHLNPCCLQDAADHVASCNAMPAAAGAQLQVVVTLNVPLLNFPLPSMLFLQ